MRLDTLAEKAITSFERRLVRQFGDMSSILVVFATATCTFLGVLYWTAVQDLRVEEQIAATPQRPLSIRVEESGFDEPVDRGLFRYAIMGSSECISLAGGSNLAQSLNARLASQRQLRVQAYDFSVPGAPLEYKYRAAVAASSLEPDLVIITHSLGFVFSLFGEERILRLSDVSDVGGAIIFAHATPPIVFVERYLSERFTSYENRFEHSLAPIFSSTRFEVVRVHAPRTGEADTQRQEARSVSIEPDFADAIEPQVVSKLQAETFGHPGEAFELIARAAIEKNIPVLFVITPINEKAAPANIRVSADRVRRKLVDADKYLREHYANVAVWHAYDDDALAASGFSDLVHLASFRQMAQRLVEVLDEEGFLPDE